MKTCSKCKITKELIDFEKRVDSKDGYRNYCRTCKNLRQNKRLQERKKEDDLFFWKDRAKSLNNPFGRRKGKAKNIISNSLKISATELNEIYKVNPNCYYCKIPLNKENVQFDHDIPLSKEGTHTIDNLKICCKDCNQLKGTRTAIEFQDFIKIYISRFC